MNRRTPSTSGMTMIELLVVMAILAVLGGIATLTLPSMLRAGKHKAVELAVTNLNAAIIAYEQERGNGDYPPTILDHDDFPGVGVRSNTDNCGIESVVLCLNRRGRPSRFDVEQQKELKIDNLDGDRTQVVLTGFGDDNKELYEILDPWGTPLAYFHHRDYGKVEQGDLGRITGGEDTIKAKPWFNDKMRAFFNKEGFQLISAGEDKVFNTEDDITNFQRN